MFFCFARFHQRRRGTQRLVQCHKKNILLNDANEERSRKEFLVTINIKMKNFVSLSYLICSPVFVYDNDYL